MMVLPTPRRRPFQRLAQSALPVFLLVLASGCSDDDQSPTVTVLTPELQGAMALDMSLPTLPVVAAEAGLSDALAAPTTEWISTWDPGYVQADHARQKAYREAAPMLAVTLSKGEIREHIGRVSMGLQFAHSIPAGGIPEELRPSLDRAEDHRNRAVALLDGGAREGAIVEMMMAAESLQDVSPEAVARTLVHRAETELRRESVPGAYPEENLVRAQRLLSGARLALEEGDPVKALRRSYYACQLLSVRFD
jgi:hypothetical protein